MDDKVVKKTQDTLGKIIKKPPMTEKLLKKPPFRFLHDTVTSVIKTTGFMKGLFTDTELNSENLKEKDLKMAFLQKAIDFVSLVSGKAIAARPSKIVAGHEPEKTNEFLQEIANGINKKVDNDDFVQRALKGEKPGDSSKPPRGSKRDEKKEKEPRAEKKSRDRESSGKENRDQRSGSKDRERDRKDRDDRKDKESRHKERDGSREKDRERSRDRRERDKDRDKDKENREDREERRKAPTEPPAGRIPRPSSAKGSRRRHRDGRGSGDSSDEDEDEQFRADNQRRDEEGMNGTVGEDDLPPQVLAARRMARPASARPAPPKVKQKQDAAHEPDIRVGSGKHVTNVIVDNGQASDDDDDNFMVEESELPPPPEPEHVSREQDGEDDGEHGGLVKKMLETKKGLEGGSQQAGARKTEIEKPVISDAARRKEREMIQKEINKLRGSIQTLTRSANPLGKIMDYVQEDLDSMQKELEKWKNENKEHSLALKREQSITEGSIEPLKGQLKELDQAIGDQLVLIAAVKSNIMKNDDKINKMLGSVTKS